MEKFGIVTNAEKDIGMTVTKSICEYLDVHQKVWATDWTVFKDMDVILILGGDGTFI